MMDSAPNTSNQTANSPSFLDPNNPEDLARIQLFILLGIQLQRWKTDWHPRAWGWFNQRIPIDKDFVYRIRP